MLLLVSQNHGPIVAVSNPNSLAAKTAKHRCQNADNLLHGVRGQENVQRTVFRLEVQQDSDVGGLAFGFLGLTEVPARDTTGVLDDLADVLGHNVSEPGGVDDYQRIRWTGQLFASQ